jgi:serine/threonine protein kinase
VKATPVQAVDKEHFPALRTATVDGVRYHFGHQLGRGAFSTVFKASDEWANPLAAKVYNSTVKPELWRNEVIQLRRFRCPWVPHLHTRFQHEGATYLILQNSGSPLSLCRFDTPEQRQRAAMFVARGVLQALILIHGQDHFHADVSPQNVLIEVDKDRKLKGVKLIDFAFCRPSASLAEGFRHMALWTPPPEFFDRTRSAMGPAVDIYHTGVLLLQVLKGETLDYSEAEILADQPQRDALQFGGPFAAPLAQAMAPAPAQRPSALELWRRLKVNLGDPKPQPDGNP